MDCSLPGSSVHGIFQATILEWIAIPFSRGSSQPRGQTWVSCTASRLFTIWATREDSVYVYYITYVHIILHQISSVYCIYVYVYYILYVYIYYIKYHIVYLKYIQTLFVNYTLIKVGRNLFCMIFVIHKWNRDCVVWYHAFKHVQGVFFYHFCNQGPTIHLLSRLPQ